MSGRIIGRWGGHLDRDPNATDMLGRALKVGDKVAKAITGGRAVNLSICTVTRIDGAKVYLNDSKVAVNYPGRMLIVSQAEIARRLAGERP